VPILGFSITILFFLQLTPGRVAGAEMAAIFLIFTSQAWNMAFSFYHSLRSIPDELVEVARKLPVEPLAAFLAPGSALRHAGAHLEHDDVHVRRLVLRRGLRGHQRRQHHGHPAGVGSYIALAIRAEEPRGIGWAIAAMFVVILIFDQLLFRPLTRVPTGFASSRRPGSRPATHGRSP